MVYVTDCLWDGTATEAATAAVQPGRDLRFDSHRGDLNQFGKVVLNLYARAIDTVRIPAGADGLHNDGFQSWGNAGTDGLVFKGLEIVSPHVAANIQPFLLDMTAASDYSRVLMDSVTAVESAPDTVLTAQVARELSTSRLSNCSFQNQHMAFRQDFAELNGAFHPTSVYLSNLEAKSVSYLAPAGGTSITHDYRGVGDANDVSPESSATPGLSGVSFTKIVVSSGP